MAFVKIFILIVLTISLVHSVYSDKAKSLIPTEDAEDIDQVKLSHDEDRNSLLGHDFDEWCDKNGCFSYFLYDFPFFSCHDFCETINTKPKYVCDPNFSKCCKKACKNNEECKTGQVCLSNGLCQECGVGNTANCQGATPYCNFVTGTCRGCYQSDCTATAPVCSTTDGTCGPCTTLTQCQTNFPGTPVCDTQGGGACVACLVNTDCPPGLSCDAGSPPKCACTPCSCQCNLLCNIDSGQCVNCLLNANCGGTTPFCNWAGNCVPCQPSDCLSLSTTPMCVTDTTQPNFGNCACTVDSCDPSSTTPICSTDDTKPNFGACICDESSCDPPEGPPSTCQLDATDQTYGTCSS